ncbi:hypothetical protein DFH09DRAFT_1087388 [Mycena vulgaris]|nr:hypothetical protein DFH09DRAFT_1087388 [Mycena vulgaris]
MAITEPTKSCAIRARDKNPPKSSNPRAKRFADGDDGTKEIVGYIRRQEEESDEAEPEFKYNKKEVMAAVDFLQKIVQHRPDLDEALPLGGYLHKFRASMVHEVEEAKVQRDITSFFK